MQNAADFGQLLKFQGIAKRRYEAIEGIKTFQSVGAGIRIEQKILHLYISMAQGIK